MLCIIKKDERNITYIQYTVIKSNTHLIQR